MNRMLQIISSAVTALAVLSSINASAADISALQAEAKLLQANAVLLVESNMPDASVISAQQKSAFLRLADLKLQIESIKATENIHFKKAVAAVQNALEVTSWDQSHFTSNRDTNVQVLIEMYLEHVDTELMYLEFGIGSDLKKAKQ